MLEFLTYVTVWLCGILLVCGEVLRFLRRRFASRLGEISETPRPALARLAVASGISLAVAAAVLVVNMSCVLGCVGDPMQRVMDWMALLPMVAVGYCLIRCVGAAYWHVKHALRR